MLCTCWMPSGQKCVNSNDIVKMAQLGAVLAGLIDGNFTLDGWVATPSKQGTMAPAFHGHKDSEIWKMGRWHSDTHVMCIHKQVT